MKNPAGKLGLFAIGVAVLSVLVAIASFAIGYSTLGIVTAVAAALLLIFGFGWIHRQRTRVLREERQWLDEHGTPPPGS